MNETADKIVMRALAEKFADERAHRIATIAAQELIQSEGERIDEADNYRIPSCQVDGHTLDCIQHLCWVGEAVSHETPDGYVMVQLGDFTLGSLA